ncbi:hypothetical protein ACFPRL_28000 [Pseudoclavibacter helvolus]
MTSRFQTSTSFSSGMRFQLIASTFWRRWLVSACGFMCVEFFSVAFVLE